MGIPQFNVRSNVHMTNLDSAIQRLLVNESLIDVTLACDGHKFQCHRLVLAAASPLFEELLKEHPKKHPIVIIPIGVKWHILKSLIDFMYRGQTCIDQAELKTLVESAELLQVIGLYDPQTQFREVGVENEATSEGNTKDEDEEERDFQREHREEDEEQENVKRTEAEDDGKKKETIVDYIEIDDSQDESSQPAQGYLITKDQTTMTNEERDTTSVEIQTDSPSMLLQDEPTNQSPQETTTQTTQSAAAIETEIPPLIRVKPTIKLINLFKLNRPGEGNQGSPKVPWTYIHIPATSTTPNEQVPFVAMPQLMQITMPPTTPAAAAAEKPIQELAETTTDHGNTPVSSFLKFNSSSMAISIKNPGESTNLEQQFQDENEAIADAEPELILDKIKDETVIKTESMDLDDRGEIEAEAENIICQPNISYIYDGNDEYGKDLDGDGGNAGVCIDYDRLVAETYGNLEQPKPKKRSNHKKCKRPKSQPSSEPSSHQHNVYQRLKEPANLVSLGPFHCEEKTEDPGDNTMQDSSDSHTQNAVILRNPRCNQPRHYSNESLYAALMAVKYGDSIYRASRLHKVPRKTLRNWMKRWDIKSQYPMPKQLKDAAKKKKLSQSQNP